jgi:hypothetical protein
MNITIKVLDSSVLSRAFYDRNTRCLGLVFSSGKCYRYADVPRNVVDSLASAPSAGAFFNAHIKGVYEARRDRTAEALANE